MNRWTKAYPGVVKVTHDLGKFKTEQEAYVAFEENIRPLIADLSEDQVHPILRSDGYGDDRVFWGEIHFASDTVANKHLEQHGGECWYCVAVHGLVKDSQPAPVVKKWLADHTAVTGRKDQVRIEVIRNDGRSRMAFPNSPDAYAFFNDVGTAMLFKLGMGGKA